MSTYSSPDEEEDDLAPSASTSQLFTSSLPNEEDQWPTPGLTSNTAFDAYFQHASAPARTSSSVFSTLLSPLSPEEYAAGLESATRRLRALPEVHAKKFLPAQLNPNLGLWHALRSFSPSPRTFEQYYWEMRQGFDLLFYGLGSKRGVMNAFAKFLAGKGAHVVVVNGFSPGFQLKDLVGALEGVLDATELEGEDSGAASAESKTDGIVRRVCKAFSGREDTEGDTDDDVEEEEEAHSESGSPSPHLYLILHSHDAPALRSSRARTLLTQLARASRVHFAASFDHIAFPTRHTLSSLFAPRPVLWHDLTTLAPYDAELAHSDPAALSSAPVGAPSALSGAGSGNTRKGAVVSESAARHVLASVTQKARKLFVLLGMCQLEVMTAGADTAGPPTPSTSAAANAGGAAAEEGMAAYDYARLFGAARDAFVATSDAALRALLAEFRDHGLVVSVAGDASGGEALWIPMRKEALARVVQEVRETEGVS
ncbi:hypothetical protein SCP_0411230 [Sparassis crispa]|uniref:Origin recognition complex subunit 2 n=1 Tax=Sparassis crispa TaxID=139825 RepID=A0A401GKP1_9APHY|nr:hypothetical protein SCP_0411230 [Sparassis crispa]GBE82738.1 hypothetical protein SCP_0411230 [Sparassis crispa]